MPNANNTDYDSQALFDDIDVKFALMTERVANIDLSIDANDPRTLAEARDELRLVIDGLEQLKANHQINSHLFICLFDRLLSIFVIFFVLRSLVKGRNRLPLETFTKCCEAIWRSC